MKSLIKFVPQVDLPQYFTVRSISFGPKEVAVKVDATLTDTKKWHKAHRFTKPHITLEDALTLFEVDKKQVPRAARFGLAMIPLPRDFELTAERTGVQNQIRLRFELQGESEKTWTKTFDTTQLNLRDLAVLVDWAQEAVKHQRH